MTVSADTKARLAAKKVRVRKAAIKLASREYTPELAVPEGELKALAAQVVKLTYSKAPPNLTVFKALLTQARAAAKRAKANSVVDSREFEAAVEGILWAKGLSPELEKTYRSMGYVKTDTPDGPKFRKTLG